MPAKISTGGLFRKLGSRIVEAHEAARERTGGIPTNSEMPIGVNGVARLTECSFGTYKTGKLEGEVYFRAAAVAVLPETFKDKDGVTHTIAGRQISLLIPLCDTPDSTARTKLAENYAYMIDYLRNWGVGTAELEGDADELESSFSDIFEELPGMGVHFKFRTWGSAPNEKYPNPRTNYAWEDVVPEPEGVGDQLVEEDPNPPKCNRASKPAAAPAKPVEATKPAGKGKTPPTAVTPSKGTTAATKDTPTATPSPQKNGKAGKVPPKKAEPDLHELAASADAGDYDAQRTLTEMAEAAGYSEEEVAAADSWTAVADMVPVKKDEDASEDEEEGEGLAAGFTPSNRDVVYYTPTGAKKPVECEVTAVDPKKETTSLRNLDNRKVTYNNVEWSDLREKS